MAVVAPPCKRYFEEIIRWSLRSVHESLIRPRGFKEATWTVFCVRAHDCKRQPGRKCASAADQENSQLDGILRFAITLLLPLSFTPHVPRPILRLEVRLEKLRKMVQGPISVKNRTGSRNVRIGWAPILLIKSNVKHDFSELST